MSRGALPQTTLQAAVADAGSAVLEFDDARAWLDRALRRPMAPLSAEAWVTDPDRRRILLVEHRVRGWVPPGGAVEPPETPRQAAARELREETGLHAVLLPRPAAVTVRSYRVDWSPTLGLAYAAVADPQAPLGGEPGQPAAWFDLDQAWRSVFPEDRDRIRAYLAHLRKTSPAALAHTTALFCTQRNTLPPFRQMGL